MTWERHASVLHVLCMAVGDFRPKLEVHIHVSYADVYVCLRIFAVVCTKLQDMPCLLVPGSSMLLVTYNAGLFIHTRISVLVRQFLNDHVTGWRCKIAFTKRGLTCMEVQITHF
jgi:hypothetical protein